MIPTLTVFKGIGEQVKNIDAVLARPEVKLVPYEIRSDWVPDRNTYVRRFPVAIVPNSSLALRNSAGFAVAVRRAS